MTITIAQPPRMSDEAIVAAVEAAMEAGTATEVMLELGCQAQDRITAAAEKRRREAGVAEEAAIKAAAEAAEAKAKKAEAAVRQKASFLARIGQEGRAALSRLEACLKSGNDGGAVAAYWSFKGVASWAYLPAELQPANRAAFARYDARQALRRSKRR